MGNVTARSNSKSPPFMNTVDGRNTKDSFARLTEMKLGNRGSIQNLIDNKAYATTQ